MRKSELKTGMRVTTRDGGVYIVMRNARHSYDDTTDFLVQPKVKSYSWTCLNYYDDDDLKYNGSCSGSEIVLVEIAYHPYSMLYDYKGDGEDWTIYWEGAVIKEMTMVEIEKMVGCKVKVIK